MKLEGRIIKWDKEKAFGFISIKDAKEHVFVHRSAFANKSRIPQLGELITFTLSKDNQGRKCAIEVFYKGEKLNNKQSQKNNKLSIYLSLLFLALVIALFFINYLPSLVVFVYLGLSVITFFAYAFDKSNAEKGKWRTKESTLHILALLGGWPGAAMAQQLFRHKSQKRDFRIGFWVTVIVNIGVMSWLFMPRY